MTDKNAPTSGRNQPPIRDRDGQIVNPKDVINTTIEKVNQLSSEEKMKMIHSIEEKVEDTGIGKEFKAKLPNRGRLPHVMPTKPPGNVMSGRKYNRLQKRKVDQYVKKTGLMPPGMEDTVGPKKQPIKREKKYIIDPRTGKRKRANIKRRRKRGTKKADVKPTEA
jgi:hypothetical protein